MTFKFKYEPIGKCSLTRDDSGPHRVYVTPEGNRYKSVTSVLQSIENKALDEWKKRVGPVESARISKAATDRGTYVHEMVESAILGKPFEYNKNKPVWTQMGKSVLTYLEHHLDVCHGVELPLYSDKLQLAGTMDFLGTFDKVKNIVDFKTSKYPKDLDHITNYHYQVSLYSYMVLERYNINVPNVKLIIANEIEMCQVIDLRRVSLRVLFANIPALAALFPQYGRESILVE